jgi:hypothetical protein
MLVRSVMKNVFAKLQESRLAYKPVGKISCGLREYWYKKS